MSDPILLKDYSIINNSEIKNYCDQIQSCVNKSKNDNKIVTLFDEDTSGVSNITVFKDFNGNYMTQQYVGILRGNVRIQNDNYEDVTIIIGSRFDDGENNNFLNYVFTKAFDMSGKIFKDMSPNSSHEQTWDMLLMLIFINQLDEAIKQGSFRQYRTYYYNDSKVKGKIDINRHIKQNPIENGMVAYSTREYTIDNPINYLILLAYDCLEKKYTNSFREIIKNRKDLESYIISLKSAIFNYKNYNYKTVLNQTSNKINHPYYIKYEELRKTSNMILRRLGLNIFKEANNEVFGVLIDMNKLWEKFLYKVIFQKFYGNEKSRYKQEGIQVLLSDNQEGKTKGKRTFKPDFYIESKMIFDAKYRRVWGNSINNYEAWDEGVRNDVFQVMGYMLALNVDVGGVVFPAQVSKQGKETEENLNIEKFKVSNICFKNFYRIPYQIPSKDRINDFSEDMDKQNKKIEEYIKGLL